MTTSHFLTRWRERPLHGLLPRLAAVAFGVPATLASAQQDSPSAPAPPAPSDRIEWLAEPGSFTELRVQGETLWRFSFDAGLTNNAFHPLALPGVETLTLDRPGDHVHHHGLWFCWKYINGVNFWEHAPGEDRPGGRTEWTAPVVTLGEDGSARFAMTVAYSTAEAGVLLGERRVIEVAPPATDGSYAIDWSSHFEALADTVVLDRTPLPDEPGGVAWGGYAGLSARLVQLTDRRAITLAGDVEFNDQDRFRGRAGAFEYSGLVGDQEVGVAILCDPGNLNSPSPWYAIRSGVMSFFTPAVLCDAPHELSKGEGFDLRYRVVVHHGRWSREQLAAAYGEYTGAGPGGTGEEPADGEEATDE